ncbi:MAG: hypothetical protein RMX56_06330 [Planktomarina sp.]|nr:hypothetical protein [Planktomarina sp.]MDT2050585.1 hypothetical protein [Planktomarina sp.]|tara:strand:- start:12 stop:236 length:225 start_codon:yes stop_codon:yes gene_type:complete
MNWLVLIGVIVTCSGLGLLLFTIGKIWQAKKDQLNELEMKAQLQSAIVWNLGAMGCSGIGLMIIVLGITLKAYV